MKGIFKIKPPTPRYKTTWDPHIVLNYLSPLGTGDKLTLKLLSMKLLMLTALVSAQRGQSLHMLDIRFMKEGETQFEFLLPEHFKQSRPGYKPPSVMLKAYPTDKTLCVVSHVKEYLRRTKPLRGDSTKLFISFMKPLKHISRETLSRCIKTVMEAAGIYTSISIPTAQGKLPHQKQKQHVYPFRKSWTLQAGHHKKYLTDFITSLHLMNLRLLTHF